MKRPNIIYIMADDHAAHAISAYGSKINKTPAIDRLANEGMLLDNCFCCNSICAPSRATILTGKHSHLNGVKTLRDRFDGRQDTFPKLLQAAGYQTAIVGKWHLGEGGHSSPTGFDYWNVLPGQGLYDDPLMLEMGQEVQYKGHVTDIITDLSLKWLEERDTTKPFLLLCHHKAPHRPWIPAEKHAKLYENDEIPQPPTFHDNYENRATAASEAEMRILGDMGYRDLNLVPPEGVRWGKIEIPDNLDGFTLTPIETGESVSFETHDELKNWMYQRYIKDYLRCVAGLDESVGQILAYLDKEGIAEDTIVVYTSDQGFFLGDHGWYDKRFMYEESLRMPFLIRYPRKIKAKSRSEQIITNLDFAPTFLDYAQVECPEDVQGESFKTILEGGKPERWRSGMYYRYWMHLTSHNVPAHYGIRTKRYKLIYYYGEALGTAGSIDEPKTPEWELFDLETDPYEMNNVYNDPAYIEIRRQLTDKLHELKTDALDFE